MRVIKKYPNRRLYDTAVSTYITLEDVKRLVLEDQEFRIVDSRSDEDITRHILLQIIAEQETHGKPLFSTELLTQFIRLYSNALQEVAHTYLNMTAQLLFEQQSAMRAQMQTLMSTNPLHLMAQLAERNLALWKAALAEKREGSEEGESPPQPPKKEREV